MNEHLFWENQACSVVWTNRITNQRSWFVVMFEIVWPIMLANIIGREKCGTLNVCNILVSTKSVTHFCWAFEKLWPYWGRQLLVSNTNVEHICGDE